MPDNEFEKEKRINAWASGFCGLLQTQILNSKTRDEMLKIQKEHAENCPQCKGNIYVFGIEAESERRIKR